MFTFVTPLLLSLSLGSPPVTSAASAAPASFSEMVEEHAAMAELLAQGDRKQKRKGRRHGLGRMSSEERKAMRTEVERKVQTFVTVELATRLGLDEKEALKLSAAFKAHRERKAQAREKMHAEYSALKDLLDKSGTPDSALRAQTQKVLAAKGTTHGPDDTLFVDTKKFLSAQQQARLVLALPDVQREVHRMMKRARGRHGGKAGQRGMQD